MGDSWKAGLNKTGVYYQGIVLDMQKVLDQHALSTGTCFGTRTSKMNNIFHSSGTSSTENADEELMVYIS